MKKQCLIVFATVAITVIGLGSLASVRSSGIVVEIPGITAVQDEKNDFLLRRCDPDYPWVPCSLFPSTDPPPTTLPGWFDVKNAKIIQLGPKWVELSIALLAPIPLEPPLGFVDYFWQFQGGCIQGSNVDKAGVHVGWNGAEWKANWYMIVSCNPRVIEPSDEQLPFQFTKDGVKVRVTLEDLLTAIDPPPIGPGYLVWHAGVRRVPFIWPQPCGEPGKPHCYNTTAVDYAPDVLEFLDCGDPPEAPCAKEGNEPATWEPR